MTWSKGGGEQNVDSENYIKNTTVNEQYKFITRIRDFTLSLKFNYKFHYYNICLKN